jgi:hypothetical protein
MHGKLRLIRSAFLLLKYDYDLFRVMFQICKSSSMRLNVFHRCLLHILLQWKCPLFQLQKGLYIMHNENGLLSSAKFMLVFQSYSTAV